MAREPRCSCSTKPSTHSSSAEIRGTDLHAELSHQYEYDGSYPVFQRQLRLLRPAVVRDPEIRFETVGHTN